MEESNIELASERGDKIEDEESKIDDEPTLQKIESERSVEISEADLEA